MRVVTKAVGVLRACALLVLFIAFASGLVRGQSQKPLLLRDPTLSRTQIAFSYAGSIWVANRDGSDPRRLTGRGHEEKPFFSPDGSYIAYTGNYDGTRSVYIVPASGGEPRRLTYHPADIGAAGWTPDARHVLFTSGRSGFLAWPDENMQLFTVPMNGGFATPVALPRSSQGSYSGDGSRIAYVPNVQWQHAQDAWKHYRGGQTQRIWIARLADSSIEAKIPRENSNDFNPMWVGEIIYFLSDRNGPVSLFSYDLRSQQVRQIAKNDGFDIKSASASSDAIIYEQFGSLHLFDLESGTVRTLDVRPKEDFPQLHPHFLKIDPASIRAAAIAPTGDCAALAVHGEILTVCAQEGRSGNLTHTSNAVERDPSWSPDGKSIAYFSDESGEYTLHVRDRGAHGKLRKIDLGHPSTFYYLPSWSPDSSKIAYTDKRMNSWYVDLKNLTPVLVDTAVYPFDVSQQRLAWSPDSRWIAYTRQLPNYLHALYVYSLDRRHSFQLTDGISDVLHVAFDKGGQYLYFTASTDVGLATAGGEMEMTSFQHPVTRHVYAMVLRMGVPSPLAVSNNAETVANTAKMGQRRTTTVEQRSQVEIDLDQLSQRIVRLPLPLRNYSDLVAGKPGVIFVTEGPQIDPVPGKGVMPENRVIRFDLRSGKTKQILNNATFFRVAFNGEEMLYAKQNRWFVALTESSAAEPRRSARGRRLNLDKIQVYVDPRVEWRHMYEQVWRAQRDFFYDPGLHGLNLETIRKKYEPFLENLSSREDLDYLFREMLGNISVGHLSVHGVDTPRPSSAIGGTGLLGADYSVENGRYRLTRVYDSDPWDPNLRAPLTQPGMHVEAGEYLLAVNGRDVHPPADLYSFFEGTAGKSVLLKIGSDAEGTKSRDISVIPIADESHLRYYAWLEGNRRKVDQWTDGRVAYVHVPDTAAGGYASLNRYYFAQVGKQAAIIDARYNHGGVIADYMIDYLKRPLLNYWHMREGRDITTPLKAIFGPKVMLTNEMAGSGGDALAWMFRRAGIGPLIGQRTWGGLVGIYTMPEDLLDGGFVTSPNEAFYNPDGTWDVENHGVLPDIEVEDDPQAERAGHDRQLEKAVEVVLELLKKNPLPPLPQHPPYPNYQH